MKKVEALRREDAWPQSISSSFDNCLNPVRIGAFISIPRNASTTIRTVLNLGHNRSHDDTDSLVIHENHQRGIILKSKYNLERLFTFCFVRNPYDRCVSWYEFHRRIKPYNSLTFEGWVKEGMPHHWGKQNETDYIANRLSPLLQLNFIERCKVDFVGKIENFTADFNTVVNKLNFICAERELSPMFRYVDQKLNVSSRSHCILDYYNNSLKKRVSDLLIEDFVHFGYKV